MERKKQITLFSSWKCRTDSSDDNFRKEQTEEYQDWGDDGDEVLAKVLEQSLREYQDSQKSSHGGGPSQHRSIPDAEEEFGIESTPVLPPCRPLESLPGFDLDAGRTWIYPVNYPVRQYQYDIVHKSLFLNTLVALPTGLGKTFIAAVVMYNFYRWYPQGKVIFMAPTKPLVTQQVEACYNVMGIPQVDTAEMTGTMNPANRVNAWKKKRMFFLTPQVLTNDLSRGVCPTENVCCIVLDEAHKAQGNHAYCQVVRELSGYNAKFRILALSATPGTDLRAVQQVIQNLQISHIELRSEDSPDIAPYTYARKIEKIVVDLGSELQKIKAQYLSIVRVHVKRLIDWRAIYTRDETTLSKFQILKAREAFRQNPPDNLPRHLYGVVEGEFALCMTLYHALELLQLHGAKSFYSFLQGTLDSDKGNNRARGELLRNPDFIQLMQNVEENFHPGKNKNASTSQGSSGLYSEFSSPKLPKMKSGNPYVVSHPKLEKLRSIILEHFRQFAEEGQSTRVMIFSQYRDSVKEITEMLQHHQPQVKAMSFVGQSSVGRGARGFSQKEQLKVVKGFREGGYNTLVSTCVGEEGLDIGEVDLIICFDAPKSPIRLVQRMGRTGRKRKGRIVVLVTKGKEEQTYNQSQYQKKSIHSALMNGQSLKRYLYPSSERMVPRGVEPVCHKLIMKMDAWDDGAGKGKKRKSSMESSSSLFSDAQSGKGKRKSVNSVPGNYLTPEEWCWYKENLQVSKEEIKVLPTSCMATFGDVKENHASHEIEFGKYQPWQTTKQPAYLISHSQKSCHLVELTEFMDLMVTLGPDDDSYGLEMASFLEKKYSEGEKETVKGADSHEKKSSPVVSRAKRGRKKGVKTKGIQRRIDVVFSQQEKHITCQDSSQHKVSNGLEGSNQHFKNVLTKFACNQEEEKDCEEGNPKSRAAISCSSETDQVELFHSSQRSYSNEQHIEDEIEIVKESSSSQNTYTRGSQTGYPKTVSVSQKSPKKKSVGSLQGSFCHIEGNQPWEVMSAMLGLPKVPTSRSPLQIRTPPPDFESLDLDGNERRGCYDIIDMIEECERCFCEKMNNNMEKIGIMPVWGSFSNQSSGQETPERGFHATENAVQKVEDSMDELPELMQPSPKIMSKSYSRKSSISICSMKISSNEGTTKFVNTPVNDGCEMSPALYHVEKSPEKNKLEFRTGSQSVISPVLSTTYRKPFKPNHIQCSSTPKASMKQLFREVSDNHIFLQKDSDYEMPSPIIKGHSDPSTCENMRKTKRSLLCDTVDDGLHPLQSVNQKSRIAARLNKFSSEPTSDIAYTSPSKNFKGQDESFFHRKPPVSESSDHKTCDVEENQSDEDLFAEDFNIDLTAVEKENVKETKVFPSETYELAPSEETFSCLKNEENSASISTLIKKSRGTPSGLGSSKAKELEPVHDNLAINFELSLGDDLFDDKYAKCQEGEQGSADEGFKQGVVAKELTKEESHTEKGKPGKSQMESHSLLSVTQIIDLVNEPSFQKQSEDCELQSKGVARTLSYSEKSIGVQVCLVKPTSKPASTGSQQATKKLLVVEEVSKDSELHNLGSCIEGSVKAPEEGREESQGLVKESPYVGNSLNFSLLDDLNEVEIMKETLLKEGTTGFEVPLRHPSESLKIIKESRENIVSDLFNTENLSQSLLQDIEMNRNLNLEDVARKQATNCDTKLSQSLLHSDEDSPLKLCTKRKAAIVSSDEESPKYRKKKLQCHVIHDSSVEHDNVSNKNKSISKCESTMSKEDRFDTRENSDVKGMSPEMLYVKKAKLNFSDDEEDVFAMSEVKVFRRKKKVSDRPGKQGKKLKNTDKKCPNQFICEEAELSIVSGEEVSGDEEENLEPNTSDESFVDDNTELTQDEKIDMKAVYLQSVKSPKALQSRSMRDVNLDVFSQPDADDYHTDDDADSFVVSNDCIEYDTEYIGDTMLDEDSIIQKVAVEDFRGSKKYGTEIGKGKRRRIILQDSTDCTSEEEDNHKSIRVRLKGNICSDNLDYSSSSPFTSPVKSNCRERKPAMALNYSSSSPVVSPVKETLKEKCCTSTLDYSSSSPATTPVKVKRPCQSLDYSSSSPASTPVKSVPKEQWLSGTNAESLEYIEGLILNRHEVVAAEKITDSVLHMNKLSRRGTNKPKLPLVDSDSSRMTDRNQSALGKISQRRQHVDFTKGSSQNWELSQDDVLALHEDNDSGIPSGLNRGSKADKVKFSNERGSSMLLHENCKSKGVTVSTSKSEACELTPSQDYMRNSSQTRFEEMRKLNEGAAREARLARQRAKQEEFRQKYALKQQDKSPVKDSPSAQLTSSQDGSVQDFENAQKNSGNYSFKTNIAEVDSPDGAHANFSLGFTNSDTIEECLQDFKESSIHTKQYTFPAHSTKSFYDKPSSSSAKPVSTGSLSLDSLDDSVASLQDYDQTFLILIGSSEVNGGGRVISTLRIKYKACTAVVPLAHADYAVSRRMGVWRQSLSGFSSSTNKTSLILKVQKMLEMFERPVIIVEKEPAKPNETPKVMTRTKYLDSILCAFVQVGQMKVLHSNDHNETASLLWALAKQEKAKGYDLAISATVVSKLSQTINFYKRLPQISYATAVFLAYTFPNIVDFMSCSVMQLEKRTGWSRQRVVAVHQFLRRIFREDMLPT